MTRRWGSLVNWIAAVLAAPVLALSPMAVAAAVHREHLLTFASLPEALRSVAAEAFADLDRSKGKQRPAGKARPGSVRFAEFDLNQDDSPELLLLREDGRGCADNTCPVRVLQRRGNGWQRIGDFQGYPDILRVYQRSDLGYYRLGNQPVDAIRGVHGWRTIQAWWDGRYWDIEALGDAAFGWPGEELRFRPLTQQERDSIVRRSWLGDPNDPISSREKDDEYNYHVAAVDLNDDGQDELILVATDFGSCGSAGCSGEILQRRGERWAIIGAPRLSADTTRLLRRRHNGYRMLSFFGPIVWDGEKYHNYGDKRDDQDY